MQISLLYILIHNIPIVIDEGKLKTRFDSINHRFCEKEIIKEHEKPTKKLSKKKKKKNVSLIRDGLSFYPISYCKFIYIFWLIDSIYLFRHK